ncbi:MAG: glycosyltransferase family 4 protein [Anaerolineales bacterium]
MRITLVHYSAPPVVGGVESVLRHHARLMASRGHSVSVIAGRGSAFDRRVHFVKIPLVDSRHSSILKAKAQLDRGSVPTDFDALTQKIESRLAELLEDADVLIAHNVCSLHKNLALTAAINKLSTKIPKMRTILWHHDLAWTSTRYQRELYPGYPWDLIRTPWPGVTQVTISQARRQELSNLLRLPPEKICVVPNGIDTGEFLRLGLQARELVEQLKLFSSEPLLFLPVRVTRRKNIELALNTLARLRETHPSARLVVTGPLGAHNPANLDYFEELKEMRRKLSLNGSAHFLAELVDGSLSDEAIADFYRFADALFLPSLEEGFGIPMIEAGLSGMPVFCSDIDSLRALGGGDVNYFSPKDDPGKVATLIATVLDGDPRYRLRVRIRQEFAWQAIYDSHITPLLESSA